MKKLFILFALLLTACGTDESQSSLHDAPASGTSQVILEEMPWTLTMHWYESEEATGCEIPEAKEHSQTFEIQGRVLEEKSKELFYVYDDCRVDQEKQSVECFIGNNVETAYATCEPSPGKLRAKAYQKYVKPDLRALRDLAY